MRIFVTSYTYIYEHNHHIFDHFEDKEKLFFVLPEVWKSTKGDKQTYYPTLSNEFRQVKTQARFHHSKYLFIGGQLKGWMPRLESILRKYAKSGDVLYSAYEPNLFVTYLYSRIAKRMGMKHVFSSWQNVTYDSRLKGIKLFLTRMLLKRNFKNATGGLFGMKKAFDVHKPYLKYNENLKTDIIPQTGIDTESYRPGLNSDLINKHAKKAKTIFLFTSTFSPRKGPMETLKAFERVNKNVQGNHLVMVGTGELENEMSRFVQENGIHNDVTFLPWQPVKDLAAIFSSTDVLVHPSQPYNGWEEQFGLLMLQAQSCGIPVITTKSGSLNETVLENKTGLHVSPGSVDELEVAMLDLAKNENRRKAMGKDARAYIIEHFSQKSVGRRLEGFLISI